MITCEHLLGFLTDYVENNLAPDERARFEEHLAVCPDCVNYLRNFQTTLRACQCARGPEPTEESAPIPENLVQAILAARKSN